MRSSSPMWLLRFVAELEQGLSHDRLARYRPRGGDDLGMVTTYFWNVALCQSLYPSLSALEVSMRNGLHDALTAHFSVRVSSTTVSPPWYDTPQLLLARERDQVDDIKMRIRRSGRTVTPPRVVAGLSYGFWTSLLNTGYGTSIWTAKNPAVLIQRAFPHAPVHLQIRSRVHDRFNRIRFLRNRISHLEPIWEGVRMPNGQVASLIDLHEEIVDAIGWVAPTLQATVVALDQFSLVIQQGEAIIRTQIRQHIGIT